MAPSAKASPARLLAAPPVRLAIHPRAARNAAAAVGALGAMIVAGSGGMRHFDGALAHYALGALVALFALVYRGTIWLERPPTRVLFRRAFLNLVEERRERRGSAAARAAGTALLA